MDINKLMKEVGARNACPCKSKTAFATEAQAVNRLTQIWAQGVVPGRCKRLNRAYQCVCRSWHLTSMSQDRYNDLTPAGSGTRVKS